VTVSGTADARFDAVREEFERNFTERGEVGASVCVTLAGETVVDLWGGVADPATGAPWQEDTLSTVMSCTKGAAALCAHILVDRGELGLDTPVATYWPEFAKNGKDTTTVRHVLTHTAGLPHVRTMVPEHGLADWEFMVRALEDEEPHWPVGTRQAYHGLTFGWLVGELVRRVSGRSIGRFFADEVAGPLGLDFFIGAPESEHGRIARLIPAPPPDPDKPLPRLMLEALTNPTSPIGLMLLNNGGWITGFDQPRYWSAEIPAANGISNARGLAGMYRPLALGGSAGGVRLLSEVATRRAAIVNSWTQEDGTVLGRWGFGLGFHRSADNRTNPGLEGFCAIWGESAFGHCGMGGSIGFADPAERISFGYSMNRMSDSMMPDERGQGLMDALYRCLGYTTNEPGAWVRL
jgi:CubicO group peptidase (beta-lactamase class C family)